ncbi:MAG: MFS transporter [Parvibaculaceae bacterium]
MSADVASPRAKRLNSLIAAIATIVTVDIGFGMTLPLIALILEEQKVDAWIIGLNAAMAPLGIILFGPFIPRIASRIGVKRLALACMLATAAILILLAVHRALWAWFLLRFLLGVAGGVLYTLSEAWIMHFTEDATRGRVTAVYTAFLSLGFSIGPFLIPITGTQGMLPFALAAGMVLLATAPLFFVTLDDSDFAPKPGGGEFMRFLGRAPLLLFAVATLTMFDSIMLAFYPIYGLRNGLDLSTASWTLGLAIMGNAFFQYPIGWLADRWSRMGVLWVAAFGTCLLAATLPLTIGTWLIWPVSVLIGSGAYAIYTIALTMLGDRFKGADLIAGSAAFAAMWGIGGIAGPPLAGAAVDGIGSSGIPLVLAATYVALIVGLTFSRGQLIRPIPPA